jgi:hypothetical protein
MITPNKIHYSLQVKGLFGRNKKAKFDSFELAKVDIDKPSSVEILMPHVLHKLIEIKAKPGCRYWLRSQEVEVQPSTTLEGFTSTLMDPFAAKTLVAAVVEEKVA